MKTVIFFSFFLSFINIFSQVKVGENPNIINPSAVLEAESTSKGFLPPRMTTAQRDAIQNPALGLQIFNLTTNCLEIYIAPNWQNVFCGCSSAPANLSYTNNGPITYCLNTVISPNSATTQASTPSSFTVSPSLPAGLQLNNVIGQITGTPTSLSSSANYTITASNACGSTTRILNIGVITVPATPPTISGPSAPTINTSTNYSITAVSGASSYTWTVPSGWIINSGQGTTAINVTAGSNAGNVMVTATNTCGTSLASTKAVSSWRPIVASGGTVTNYTANGTNGVNGVQYRVHRFTSVGSSTFNVTDFGTDGQVSYLVVGGGGGGGDRHGGGGGAGGVVSGSFNVSVTTYTITVGNGGQYGATIEGGQTPYGNPAGSGIKGGNSSIAGVVTANGGGGGGTLEGNPTGVSGSVGSGGGGGGANIAGVAATAGQGNAGGSGLDPAGGGGGGAGAIGANANTSTGGNGTDAYSSLLLAIGYGTTFATSPQSPISGGVAYIAGGGGGAANSATAPTARAGGLGGGGTGDWDDAFITAGTANTGSGGGASRSDTIATTGRNGGTGLVLIWFPLTNPNP